MTCMLMGANERVRIFLTLRVTFTSGAPAPAAVTKVEEAPTEPGTIIHMEKATQKIEHELLYKRVETWEESAKAKIDNRCCITCSVK